MSIVADHLSKSYTGKIHIQAVEEVSFEVEKGCLFGLIGPDGAGKTTLFRMLVTLLIPDRGRAYVNGLDVVKDYRKIRHIIGYMPGKFALYQDLSVQENLHLFTTIFHTTLQESYHLIRDIYSQLEPFAHRRAGDLSGGMKQKLALCCTLSHQPKVLFLDEPTTGVDAVSRREFWKMLHQLKEQGITILVSTPYMDEASQCDMIALMNKGQLLSVETPQRLIHNYSHDLYSVRSQDMYRALLDIQQSEMIDHCYTFGASHHVTGSGKNLKNRLVKFLQQKGHREVEITSITPTIEDCFMDLAK